MCYCKIHVTSLVRSVVECPLRCRRSRLVPVSNILKLMVTDYFSFGAKTGRVKVVDMVPGVLV